MITHVAAKGEDRGRVVVKLGATGQPSEAAIEAAVRVAQAFQSEIESLFVEDRQLLELASFPFAREISLSGRSSRAICVADIERDMQLASRRLLKHVEAIAQRAEVPMRWRVVRDEPIAALAHACAASGPWNVVALGEPFTTRQARALRELFAQVLDTTGVVVAPPKARRPQGPVVVAVEDLARLGGMLRTAERIASISGSEIRLLLVAPEAETARWMEDQARLLLAGQPGVAVQSVVAIAGDTAAMAENLRRLAGGFVIAPFGGLVVPAEGDLGPLVGLLECPLFLVR
jgi:hypothetical protein